MAKQRCAILDDYQNVALKMADWSPLAKDLDITVFDRHLGDTDAGRPRPAGICRHLLDARAHAVPERDVREAAGPQA